MGLLLQSGRLAGCKRSTKFGKTLSRELGGVCLRLLRLLKAGALQPWDLRSSLETGASPRWCTRQPWEAQLLRFCAVPVFPACLMMQPVSVQQSYPRALEHGLWMMTPTSKAKGFPKLWGL